MPNRIDIVLFSRNRIEYARQSISYILARTRTPYRLHVIDDSSTDGTVDYLLSLWREGKICDLILRGRNAGITANYNLANWLSFSDPFVITADDLLCPDVEPDWLSRGVEMMQRRPDLGELDLNNPGAYRVSYQHDGDVVYCEAVGGTFGFIRRALVPHICLSHFINNFDQTGDATRCDKIRAAGYKVGYLTETFCHHIGKNSVVWGDLPNPSIFVDPLDPITLRPPEEYIVS